MAKKGKKQNEDMLRVKETIERANDPTRFKKPKPKPRHPWDGNWFVELKG